VLAATGVAVVVGVRLGHTLFADPQILFTNVRLIPCLVRDSVQHHLAPLTSALPGSGPAAPVAALSSDVATQGAVSGGSAVNPSDVGERGRSGFQGLSEAFRDGFEDAVRGGNREIGDALGDSRLMMQLGMAFGFVYAAFLSVWFWATRLRRRPAHSRKSV
jgi:hypothetical protein